MITRLQLRDSVQYTPVHLEPLQEYVIDYDKYRKTENVKKMVKTFVKGLSFSQFPLRLIESFATRAKGHNQLEELTLHNNSATQQ